MTAVMVMLDTRLCGLVPGQPWGIANWNEVYICTGQLKYQQTMAIWLGCTTFCTCGHGGSMRQRPEQNSNLTA